jgi:hypothetical protein
MKAQEEEFRQQLDALRGKFQSLYKEGIENQKDKVRKDMESPPPRTMSERLAPCANQVQRDCPCGCLSDCISPCPDPDESP